MSYMLKYENSNMVVRVMNFTGYKSKGNYLTS